MFSRKKIAMAFGAAFLAVAATSSLQAGTGWQKTNYLTFNRSVALPGAQLAAGTYIFELAMPDSAQHLVRVMSRDRSQVYLTAFTNLVPRPRDLGPDQVIAFGEAARSVSPPIKIWYPKGGGDGREFLYK
jgi:hypothetical protein